MTMAAPWCPELAGELLCGSDSEHPWRSLRSENSGVVGKELKHARGSREVQVRQPASLKDRKGQALGGSQMRPAVTASARTLSSPSCGRGNPRHQLLSRALADWTKVMSRVLLPSCTSFLGKCFSLIHPQRACFLRNFCTEFYLHSLFSLQKGGGK